MICITLKHDLCHIFFRKKLWILNWNIQIFEETQRENLIILGLDLIVCITIGWSERLDISAYLVFNDIYF